MKIYCSDFSKELEKKRIFQEAHFLKEIHYLHRVMIMKERIKTVQTIFDVINYCGFTSTPQDSYTVRSSAVRNVKELSIHGEESCFGLPLIMETIIP